MKTSQKVISSITTNNFFPIKNHIKFGNVKIEIDNYIKLTNPDFIIIRQKQKRFLDITKDNVSHFILQKYNTRVFKANITAISEIYARLKGLERSEKTA